MCILFIFFSFMCYVLSLFLCSLHMVIFLSILSFYFAFIFRHLCLYLFCVFISSFRHYLLLIIHVCRYLLCGYCIHSCSLLSICLSHCLPHFMCFIHTYMSVIHFHLLLVCVLYIHTHCLHYMHTFLLYIHIPK